MHTHILLAHPEPQSLNATLATISGEITRAAGATTSISDLYGQDFDPAEGGAHYAARSNDSFFHTQTEQRYSAGHAILPAGVQREIDRLLACDLLIVHFPLWWFGPPAMLKGWMDRVFVYGQIYSSQRRYDEGTCHGYKMLACVTTGADAHSCAFNGREGDTKLVLWPDLFPFRYIGFDVFEPAIFHGVGGVASIEGEAEGDNQIAQITSEWRSILDGLERRPFIQYNGDADYDEDKRLRSDAPSHSPFVRHTP